METQNDRHASLDYCSKLVDFEEKCRIKNADRGWFSFIINYVNSFSLKERLIGCFPVFGTFRTYKWKHYILKDFISGVVSGVMMIPLGMAYASLSTLPHIVGLYMCFFASITYFFFGTSRYLSWGCVAVVSLMMSNLLTKYDNSDDAVSFISSLHQNQTGQQTDTTSRLLTNSNFQEQISSQIPQDANVKGAAAMLGSMGNITNKNMLEAICARRMEVASGIAFVGGTVLVLESLIGLSCFTPIMSNYLMAGFTLGIAFNIATSQLKTILGLSIQRYAGNFCVFKTWIAVVDHIQETNVAVLIISLVCIFIMYLVKRFINEKHKHRMAVLMPIELFIIIMAIVVSKYCHFKENYDVDVLGVVPIGIPSPKFPDIRLVFNYDYIFDALLIVVVAHVQSLATAKTIASQEAREIKPGQEMFAAGLCSLVCALFSGFIPGAQIPVSIARRDAGGVTQIASLFAAGVILLVIMVLGPFFYALPDCVMSAIILINLRPIFLKMFNIPEEWRRSRYDCTVLIVTCIATIVLEAGSAIIVSVAFSVFSIVLLRTMMNPVIEVVPVQMDQSSAILLRQSGQYTSAKTLLSAKVMKINAPLYFFNSESFVDAVFVKTNIHCANSKHIVRDQRRPSKSSGRKTSSSDLEKLSTPKMNEKTPLVSTSKDKGLPVISWKTLIIDMSEVSFMDMMGVEALDFVINEFQSAEITVLITSVSHNIFGILRTTGFWLKYRDCMITDMQSALSSVSRTPENLNPLRTGNGLIPQSNQWV